MRKRGLENLTPFCRCQVELVDESREADIRSSQDIVEPVNTALSDRENDAQQAGPSAELLV